MPTPSTVPDSPLALRRATIEDAELLFGWANDLGTRAASFHPTSIPWEGHVAWLSSRLASPASRLYIASEDGVPAGQVRFELGEDGEAEVSIAVAPGARGRGVGRRLLVAGIAAVAEESFTASVLARVRTDNPASAALFRGAGFAEVGPSTCAGLSCTAFRLLLVPAP